MNARSTRSRLARFAAALAVPALALVLSASPADAKQPHRHGHGSNGAYRQGYRHASVCRPACGVRHAHYYGNAGYYAPQYTGYYAPSYVYVRPAPVYVPYPTYPAPVVVNPYPVYGPAGFVGFSSPHVSVGIAF